MQAILEQPVTALMATLFGAPAALPTPPRSPGEGAATAAAAETVASGRMASGEGLGERRPRRYSRYAADIHTPPPSPASPPPWAPHAAAGASKAAAAGHGVSSEALARGLQAAPPASPPPTLSSFRQQQQQQRFAAIATAASAPPFEAAWIARIGEVVLGPSRGFGGDVAVVRASSIGVQAPPVASYSTAPTPLEMRGVAAAAAARPGLAPAGPSATTSAPEGPAPAAVLAGPAAVVVVGLGTEQHAAGESGGAGTSPAVTFAPALPAPAAEAPATANTDPGPPRAPRARPGQPRRGATRRPCLSRRWQG